MDANKEKMLKAFTLGKGAHEAIEQGACVMEMVSYFANESWSANPQCACPLLTSFAIGLNDNMNDEQRQKLKPFVRKLVGSRASIEVVAHRRKVLVAFAADIAESVLHIYEKAYPNDNRPRLAIEAARSGDAAATANAAASDAADAAADAAANAASDAADAAANAAANAAYAAANAAAYAAANAAYAAANAAAYAAANAAYAAAYAATANAAAYAAANAAYAAAYAATANAAAHAETETASWDAAIKALTKACAIKKAKKS